MKSRFDFGAAARLAALCESREIDLVHTHFLRENYIALLAKGKNPKPAVVYTNHLLAANDRLTRLSNRLLAKRQDGVIAVCDAGRAQLIENGLDAEKIEVIHHGVDPADWAPSPEGRRGETRAELGAGADCFVLLCAARFSPEKGHEFLLRSLKRLRELTTRPFLLALAGDGELLDAVKARARELDLEDSLRFLGFRADMAALYQGGDLFVNPSAEEALGFGLLEAMAAGLPLLATDVGGVSDVVNEQTDCGKLVPYGDVEAMAGAMRELMENPALAERFRRGAARAREEHFSLQKMAEDTFALYTRAIGRNAAGRREKR
jgi:glycosyltransferase involved in cell wall biosynthesis